MKYRRPSSAGLSHRQRVLFKKFKCTPQPIRDVLILKKLLFVGDSHWTGPLYFYLLDLATFRAACKRGKQLLGGVRLTRVLKGSEHLSGKGRAGHSELQNDVIYICKFSPIYTKNKRNWSGCCPVGITI